MCIRDSVSCFRSVLSRVLIRPLVNFTSAPSYKTAKKIDNKINYNIYRKPTTTDHAIHASSYHPYSHKMTFFNSMVHRLLSLPLSTEDHKNEVEIIKHIAIANGCLLYTSRCV